MTRLERLKVGGRDPRLPHIRFINLRRDESTPLSRLDLFGEKVRHRYGRGQQLDVSHPQLRDLDQRLAWARTSKESYVLCIHQRQYPMEQPQQLIVQFHKASFQTDAVLDCLE